MSRLGPTKFTDFTEMQIKYKKMEEQLKILTRCSCNKINLGRAYLLCEGCKNKARINKC